MSHTTQHAPNRRPASHAVRAVATVRPGMPATDRAAALTTLILSVLLGLLSGAVWMQLT